jgi:catechol 2,3-dioxygenase-like lactoylglutathione lyase family enzyme
MDLKLEVVVVPVSDVDRAKAFYTKLGWREDIDFVHSPGYRVVQFTPPGSEASIIIGTGITNATPGSYEGLQLVTRDILTTRDELVNAGIEVSEVFHDETGIFHHAGTAGRVGGPDENRGSYGSFLSFEDPDGNGWIVQEVTEKAPGR